MHDLAVGETSVNHAYKPVGNVHNANYIVGGISGGTAKAIAAGFVRVAWRQIQENPVTILQH